jgi:tetratricopeptide (TPR) repeat protein
VLRLGARLADEAEAERRYATTLRAGDPRLEAHHRAANDARGRGLALVSRAARQVNLREAPDVHLLLGRLLLEEGRPAEAEAELRLARVLDPLLKAGGPAPETVKDPRRLLRARRIYAYLGRAHLSLAQVRTDLAASEFLEALRWERRAAARERRDPDPELMRMTAMTVLADGRFPEGLDLLRELAETARDPDVRRAAARERERQLSNQRDRYGALVLAARQAYDEHRPKEALENYEEALRVEPNAVEARVQAAHLFKYFGRYPEAKRVVSDGLALLRKVAPGPATDRERETLTGLLADLERWDRESAEREEKDLDPKR